MTTSFAATTSGRPVVQHQGVGEFATAAGLRITQLMQQQQQKGPAPVAALKLVKG